MKKHICKIWSVVLAALLCMAMLPVSVFAAGSVIATATIPVSVLVSGEEGTLDSDIPEETYTFKLATTNSAPMPTSDTVTISGAGSAEFTIDYEAVGVYKYTLTQDSSALSGDNSTCNDRGNYDTAVYYVTVTVQNTEDGGIGVVVAAHKDSTTGDKCEIEFNNTYDPVSYPSLRVVKTAKVADSYQAAAGDTISYEIVVTNNGNVAISNITVKDDLTGESWTIDSLAANESKTFTTSYIVTETDVSAGSVKNVATASGTDPDGNPTQAEGSDEVPTAEVPQDSGDTDTYDPGDSGDDSSSVTVTDPEGIGENDVHTGDTANIALYAALMAVVAAALIILVIYSRKKKAK